MMRIIALTGPKGCGKDTAAQCLFNQNTVFRKNLFRQAPMAEGVKNICTDFFGWDTTQMSEMSFKETPIPFWPGREPLEPRWPMMDIANYLRDRFGGAIHAERWAMHAKNATNWRAHVVTDMRFPEELATFVREGGNEFLPLYIERPEAEAALSRKQAEGDAMALNPSEAHYATMRACAEEHGIVVLNDGSVEHLWGQVLTAVKLKYKHWQYWDGVK